MSLAQQVVDGLHGVEGLDGHLDKDGVPVAHRAIPQARQLQGLDVHAVLALDADEAGLGIDKLAQVKLDALVVLDVAHQVNGVEVGAALHHLDSCGVVGVDLGRLEDLGRCRAVGIIGQIGAAARFALVGHDATHADGPVELVPQPGGQGGIVHGVGRLVADAERLAGIAQHGLEVGGLDVVLVQGLEIFLQLALHRHEVAADDLLVAGAHAAQPQGHHVIDILDEHDVGIALVQVLEQGTMACRAEQQVARRVAVGRVVHVDGDGVGRGLLLAQRDVILHAPHLLHQGHLGLDQFLKARTMLGRDGEVDAHAATAVGSILSALLKVLLERGARCPRPRGET